MGTAGGSIPSLASPGNFPRLIQVGRSCGLEIGLERDFSSPSGSSAGERSKRAARAGPDSRGMRTSVTTTRITGPHASINV